MPDTFPTEKIEIKITRIVIEIFALVKCPTCKSNVKLTLDKRRSNQIIVFNFLRHMKKHFTPDQTSQSRTNGKLINEFININEEGNHNNKSNGPTDLL